jgi:hypothetical protein
LVELDALPLTTGGAHGSGTCGAIFMAMVLSLPFVRSAVPANMAVSDNFREDGAVTMMSNMGAQIGAGVMGASVVVAGIAVGIGVGSGVGGAAVSGVLVVGSGVGTGTKDVGAPVVVGTFVVGTAVVFGGALVVFGGALVVRGAAVVDALVEGGGGAKVVNGAGATLMLNTLEAALVHIGGKKRLSAQRHSHFPVTDDRVTLTARLLMQSYSSVQLLQTGSGVVQLLE